MEEGVDAILIETIFDTLNAKAALSAYSKANEARIAAAKAAGTPEDEIKPIEVMLSMTVSDASGLVQYCYGQLGIHLPRSTASQAEIGKIISYEDLMPGDAFFMWFANEDAPEFVGIYVGDGFYVAARSTGKPVSKIDVTTEYYKEHFVYGRRYY
jgi:cell wall-associated NlpC family hydrolase